jgi:RNA polymerase sigma factor for flagellar operon FliA
MRSYANTAAPTQKRDHLIAEYAGMAKRIALRVARNVPDWLSRDDLVATAMVGLTEAAERYDDTRGEPFVAFAERRVRGAVLDELRRGDILPRRARQLARKIGTIIRELEKKHQRPPEDEEIAAALSVSVEEYRSDMAMLSQVGFVELGTDDDSDQKFRISAEDSPENQAAKREMAVKLKEGLNRLQERDVLVLSLYYVEELTLAEIGEVLSVSESRVSQLHTRALARLRAEIDIEEV